MLLVRHKDELPESLRGGVVALGNFDGVHRGHQAVILTAQRLAASYGCPHGVMTFEPHPRAFFNRKQSGFRLTPFRVKSRLIESLGVDFLYTQHFDHDFAAVTAERFVQSYLVGGLYARHIVVGYDYVFGKDRQGTGAMLQKMSAEMGFGFTAVPPAAGHAGEVYSSTWVRECLMMGRPDDAARVLGHYWEMEGRVEHGDARGRTIGVPTANIRLGEYQRPCSGVYAVRAGVDLGGRTVWIDGVANFGRRPTFDKTDEILEVHLLDVQQDLYGQHLRVALIEYLRPEEKFPTLDALKSAIANDIAAARLVLADRPFPDQTGPYVPLPEA